MILKGALHAHSTCSDGTLTIEEVIRAHERLGYDFLALTDHDHLLRKGCYDILDDIETSLLIFHGVELTVFEKGYVHVNRIEGDSETLHVFNHPSEMDLPLERAIKRIFSVNERLPLDGVEVTSKGFRTPEFETDKLPFAKIASDDSHTQIMIGRAWIELDCQREKDQIIRAIRRGDFWNCYAKNRGRR